METNSRINGNNIDNLTYDILKKPLERQRLDTTFKDALRSATVQTQVQKFPESDKDCYRTRSFIGKSRIAQETREMLEKLAGVPISTMIIQGETGTGKGMVARILHNMGLRRKGPMVEMNCAALPKDLLESELFGHEAGSFTGAKNRHRGFMEQADGGTLFLDEIGDMDIELQAKLLKVIEDKKIRRIGGEREISIDVQIVAATAIDLERAVKENRFRQDLYHRLSVFCLHLPPLREHKEDLIDLVPKLIAEYNIKANKKVEVIPDPVWEKLLAHNWPGNVRELRNVIERCVLFSEDEEFPTKWLRLSTSSTPIDSNPATDSGNDKIFIPLDGSMSLDDMDSFIIKRALTQNDYNVSETARVLGTTRETLRYRIQKYDLSPD